MVAENNLSTEAVFSVVTYETAKGRKPRKTKCYIHIVTIKQLALVC